MPDAALGIDYGTSSTVAVLRHPGGKVRPLLFDSSPLLPSAVFRNDAGRLLVGRDAEHAARLDPARYEPNPKRRIDDLEVLLGDRAVPVPELVAATLTRVRAEALRTLGGPPATLTMTCPATWGSARRQVLLDAAALAGLPVPALVAEPVAAATYFAAVLGHAVQPGQCVVVYDLGAGTFDASVVQRTADGFRDLACRGLDDVGGLDLDALVVAHARTVVEPAAPGTWARLAAPQSAADLRHVTMLWTDARHLRETLSRESSASMFVPVADQEVLFTRQQFDAAAEPVLARTVQLALTTLKEARVRPDAVAGWFLVGGGTRTPLIATMLHRATGVAPTVLEEPQLVVAEGALHLATMAAAAPVTTAAPPVAAPPVPAPPVAAPPVAAPPVAAPPVVAAPLAAAPTTATPVPATPITAAPITAAPVDERLWPDPPEPAPQAPPEAAKAARRGSGVGTGFQELFALVAAAFAALLLLLPSVLGRGVTGVGLIAGAGFALAVGWRFVRLRRAGPRALDWVAIALGALTVAVTAAHYLAVM
ncbi:Hsp70 family protein [Dactylosporangium sp. CA-052675]|uniref:Hsp70 family protein n=1 Tax=Dactylosporangium sp. CA-052675 TaxID=3239927 RepID=UPI003D8EF1FA